MARLREALRETPRGLGRRLVHHIPIAPGRVGPDRCAVPWGEGTAGPHPAGPRGPRLRRSRTGGRCQFGHLLELPGRMTAYGKLGMDPPEWRVTCFFVDRGPRGDGRGVPDPDARKAHVRLLPLGRYRHDVRRARLPPAPRSRHPQAADVQVRSAGVNVPREGAQHRSTRASTASASIVAQRLGVPTGSSSMGNMMWSY
jgi:hypothetical protein